MLTSSYESKLCLFDNLRIIVFHSLQNAKKAKCTLKIICIDLVSLNEIFDDDDDDDDDDDVIFGPKCME